MRRGLLRLRALSVAAVLALIAGGSGTVAEEAAPTAPDTHALLINGGQRPKDNSLSHLHHLQDMVEQLKRRGIPPEHIHIFSSDGMDRGADLVARGAIDSRSWLIEGTVLGGPLSRPNLTNTQWKGVRLNPAKKSEIRRWFSMMRERLAPGDTLFVFVTDHGTRNREDPDNGFISLWREKLSVLEFRALLGHLRPGVRVVNVMSQCFSGGFADAMAPLHATTPSGDVCGFYSTTANRLAYGCYPEGRDRDRIGHAFRFIDALDRNVAPSDAHLEVLVTDKTPDVPVRTSDIYLENLLWQEAERRDLTRAELADELLREAWKDRGRWEPQIRLLDRLGSVFGTFSPRSLEEFKAQITVLRGLEEDLDTYGERWLMALNDLRQNNLRRFVEKSAGWPDRLQKDLLEKLDDRGRLALRTELLTELEAFTRGREGIWVRLEELLRLKEEAQRAEFRAAARLSALLRMRTVLFRVAAEQLLEQAPTGERPDLAEAREAWLALEDCETSALGSPDPSDLGIAQPLEPLPPFEEDLAVVERVLPSWLGIQFVGVPEEQREELGLPAGAVVVQQVYEASSAEAAGIRAGDFLLGTPGEPFNEPTQIREWIMGSPRDTPLPLEARRDGKSVEVEVTLGPYPSDLPRLPAPPRAGDPAPALPAMRVVSGPSPDGLDLAGRRHLLFFWATWCGPCKASVGELLAWSDTTGIPVVAVSDETASTVSGFLDRWRDPFPEIVTADELRLSYVSYGVSGTPTFVLVDEDGTVEWRHTGYSKHEGLNFGGPRSGEEPGGR